VGFSGAVSQRARRRGGRSGVEGRLAPRDSAAVATGRCAVGRGRRGEIERMVFAFRTPTRRGVGLIDT